MLKEYGDLGHSHKVPDQDLATPASQHFYMPAHGVVKEASTTTKLRVVFDASVKTPTGVSLNDTLLPIPSLYPLLTSVLNKFWLHKVALTSDISKMFREVVLDSRAGLPQVPMPVGGRNHQGPPNEETYSASPYLATQVLQQVTSDHSELYPEAARIVKSSFYVDNCLTGASTPEQAIHLQQQLYELLQQAGMKLRKWRSNSSQVLYSIPADLKETEKEDFIILDPAEYGKALRFHWNTHRDLLYLLIPTIDDSTPTKRVIASTVARLYDVLG